MAANGSERASFAFTRQRSLVRNQHRPLLFSAGLQVKSGILGYAGEPAATLLTTVGTPAGEQALYVTHLRYDGRRHSGERRAIMPAFMESQFSKSDTFAYVHGLLTPLGLPYSIDGSSRCRRGSAVEGGRLYGRDEGSRGARGARRFGGRREPHAPLHALRRGLVQAAGHSLRRGFIRDRRQGPGLRGRARRPLHDAGRKWEDGARRRGEPADEGARLLPELELPAPQEPRARGQDRRDSARRFEHELLRLLGV